MRLWPFIPQQEFTETLEWLTDVIPSKAGEQRLALMQAPRQRWDLKFILDPHQFSRAKALALAVGYRDFLVPQWAEVRRVGAVPSGVTEVTAVTSYMDMIPGDTVLVWQEDSAYDLLQVQTVGANSVVLSSPTTREYSNALLVPVRLCKVVQSFESIRIGAPSVRFTVSFETTDARDLVGGGAYPTYRGHAVMLDRPIVDGELQGSVQWGVERIDNTFGKVVVSPTRTYADHTATVTWEPGSSEDLWGLRCWLHSRKGKQKGFWMPSWNADLDLVAPVGLGVSTISVRSIGYQGLYGVKDILIISKSGALHYLRATEATLPSGGVELISLESPTSFSISLAEVQMVCFLDYMRHDADRVEIQYSSTYEARVSIPVIEVPAP